MGLCGGGHLEAQFCHFVPFLILLEGFHRYCHLRWCQRSVHRVITFRNLWQCFGMVFELPESMWGLYRGNLEDELTTLSHFSYIWTNIDQIVILDNVKDQFTELLRSERPLAMLWYGFWNAIDHVGALQRVMPFAIPSSMLTTLSRTNVLFTSWLNWDRYEHWGEGRVVGP